MTDMSVSFRVDFGPHCSVGPGKIALLENIGRTGSLSQAARALDMSYRRAWLLLAETNDSFQQTVARMSVGGRGGGGATLTPFGTELVAAYRSLEANIRKQLPTAFPASAVPSAAPQRLRTSSPIPRRRRAPPSPQRRARSRKS
ncbi:MAG TPA: hypothetical protein VFB37_00655 [Steroidobacteraceae bacterium]|nr:hypothetical protein [Steroidobacteraceae bacterium]